MSGNNNDLVTESCTTNLGRRRFVQGATLTAVGMALGSPTASASIGGPGVLVPIGGRFEPENEILHEKLIDLGGGEDDVQLAIFPTASGTPTTSAEAFRDDFNAYGVPEDQIDIIEVATEDDPDTTEDESEWVDNAHSETWADRVRDATLLMFTGGNQLRIIDALTDEDGGLTPVGQAVYDVYDDGGVIAGSSAGAGMMCDPMIGAGESFGALKDGVSYEDTYDDDDDHRVFLTDGFDFLEEGLCDQHFMERGRFGRLVRAMWHEDPDTGIERNEIGYGVDENTGFIFDPEADAGEVCGEGGVTIVDLSEAYEVSTGSDALHLEDMLVHYLTHGDVFHFDDRTVTPDTAKDWDCVDDPYYDGNRDSSSLFDEFEIVDLLSRELVDNTDKSVYSEASERGRTLEMEFWQENDTEGFWGRSWPEDDEGRYAIANVRAAVWPDH